MPEFKSKDEYEKWEHEKKTQKELEADNEKKTNLGQKTIVGKKNMMLYLILTFILGFVICGLILYLFVSSPKTAKVEDIKNPIKQTEKEVIDKLDTTKFDGVNRASKKVEASMNIGISYQQFGELLQNLATEILIARDKISTDREKAILGRYSEALDIYKDSHLLWKYKIEDHAKGDVFALFDVIEVRPDMIPIISKYNLSEKKYTDPVFSTISVESIKIIWIKALEKTNSL